MNRRTRLLIVAVCALAMPRLDAQQPPARPQPGAPAPAPAPQVVTGPQVTPPDDYVIGSDDKLGVLFWRDETMSAEVLVRPDGKISLPLLNEMHVLGLTPEQLRLQVLAAAKKFVEAPNVTVVVREINSRKVFITGQVTRPGSYPVTGPMTVLQLIAVAGGVNDFADSKKIVIIRRIPGTDKTQTLKFNYDDVRKGKNLDQNVTLKIGDTVVVPG